MNKLKIKKLVLSMLIVMLVSSIFFNFKLYYNIKILNKISVMNIEEGIFNLIDYHLKEKQEVEETLEMER